MSEPVRLQKVLANAGIASRRAAEDLIAAGRVSVDGVVVTQLGTKVDPEAAVIHVDGDRVATNDTLLTVALNKPRGVLSTMDDPQGRPTLEQFTERYPVRLNHVGRLDNDSEGLLLLSNDGELTHRLTHPSFDVPKVYQVTVRGNLSKRAQSALRSGVELEDGPARADKLTIKAATSQESLVELVLHEGRNRIVRRMLDEVGFPVTRLVRTAIGPIRLGELRPGRTRVIKGAELHALMRAVQM